jgi:hypothetical protein
LIHRDQRRVSQNNGPPAHSARALYRREHASTIKNPERLNELSVERAKPPEVKACLDLA